MICLEELMKQLPEPIGKKDSVSAIVFGIVSAAGLVLIVYRILIE